MITVPILKLRVKGQSGVAWLVMVIGDPNISGFVLLYAAGVLPVN